MRTSLIAIFIFISMFSFTSNAQDWQGLMLARSVQFQRGLLQFDHNGRFIVQFLYSDSPFENIDVFEDKVLIEYLELSANQQTQVSQFLERWKKKNQELTADWNNSTIAEAQEDREHVIEVHAERIKKADTDALVELQGILLPHQVRLLDQFSFRCLLRNYGLVKVLEHKNAQKLLGIEDAEAKQVSRALQSIKPALIRKSQEAKQKALSIFFQPFSPEQKTNIAAKWPEFVANDHNTDCLTIGLSKLTKEWHDKNGVSGDQVLLRRPLFQTAPSGNFELSRRYPNNGFEDELHLFATLWEFDEFSDYLQISESQVTRIDLIIDSTYMAACRLDRELSFQSPVSPPEFAAVKSRVDEEKIRLRRQGLQELKVELRSEQWARFLEYARTAADRSLGPLYDILHGPLSKQLELTPAQRKSIEESAVAALDDISKSSKEIEQILLNTALDKLPESARGPFGELIGDPIEGSPVSVVFLLLFM